MAVLSIATLAQLCQTSPVGKQLPNALYVHRSALPALSPELQRYDARARELAPQVHSATLVKINTRKPQVSYLFYPGFETEPHPALARSVQVNLETLTVTGRDYSRAKNPPILHRKETFVTPSYPHYEAFAWLTQQEEALGLLDGARGIGFSDAWQRRLEAQQLEVYRDGLACPIQGGEKRGTQFAPQQAESQQAASQQDAPQQDALQQPTIQRHKAAIARVSVSKPVRLAVEAGLFTPDSTYFDYGCGRGADVEYVKRLGYASSGWDPHYRPDGQPTPADVVNLGYVINVIEEAAERRETLIEAWDLAQRVLIVAAQVLVDDRSQGRVYGDGIITRRNTFQKYYEQEELKAYVDQVLGVDAVPMALGIYAVFRDEAQAESFRASRFRSRVSAPRICLKVSQFERYRELLQPLMAFYAERGRLPAADEVETQGCGAIAEELGSLRRAFTLVLQATNRDEWEAIAETRRQDLMVYLALSHFGRRPQFKHLTPTVQHDVKALFGSYRQACTAADLMLMSLGNTEILAQRCRQSAVGQQRPNSLWVHVSALEKLDPLLRLYEGCASRTIGRLEEATVVKFHIGTPRITYLVVPEFDADPHPALHTSMQIDLQDLRVRYRDYDPDNPPLLHQKAQVVAPDYPSYEKFAKLSGQEQRWGLLDDMKGIGDRRGWQLRLAEYCAELRGHRVVWRKDADPYRVRVLKAAIRRR